jgi:dCMP deaminase
MNEQRTLNHWDDRYIELAEFISKWSKDPSTKVGAVITDDKNRVVSLGFNGFPRGIDDTIERLGDREIKYSLVVHGERNAILFANRDLTGCRLYTVPFMPCSVCAGMVIQAGIKEVIAPFSDNERWSKEFKIATSMFEEAGVNLYLMKR